MSIYDKMPIPIPMTMRIPMTLSRAILACAATIALAACGGTGGKTTVVKSTPPLAERKTQPSAEPVPAIVPRPAAPARPAPRVMSVPGLEGVIGADGAGLVRQFGPPRLDIQEDDARKLQWSGTACILDVYLYPTGSGGRATATYLDARASDGRDTDRAACVAALRKRP